MNAGAAPAQREYRRAQHAPSPMTQMINPSRILLGYYEAIGHVSFLMREAASRSDWNAVENAHACCEELIRCVRATGLSAETLDEHARRRRMEILRQVIADDARIRELADPALNRLDALFGGRAATLGAAF